MKTFFGGAVLMAGLLSGSASAASVVLSGNYALSYTSTCAGSVFTPSDAANGDVQSVIVQTPGSASTLTGIATFDPAHSTVAFAGQSSGTGGLLQVSTTTNGASPLNPYSNAVSYSAELFYYSPTSIFLPFIQIANPKFTASYLVNNGTGIARIVTFSSVGTSPAGLPCTQSGILAR